MELGPEETGPAAGAVGPRHPPGREGGQDLEVPTAPGPSIRADRNRNTTLVQNLKGEKKKNKKTLKVLELVFLGRSREAG